MYNINILDLTLSTLYVIVSLIDKTCIICKKHFRILMDTTYVLVLIR